MDDDRQMAFMTALVPSISRFRVHEDKPMAR
jgi:hypothetical protein